MLKSKIRADRYMDLMHRKLFPKALFFLTIALSLTAVSGYGQEKAEAELVVSKCWSYGIEAAKTLAVDGTGVYIGRVDRKIEAVSLDGQKLWTTDFGGELVSNVLVTADGMFFVTSGPADGDKGNSGGSSLRVLSKETGIPKRIVKLPDAEEHFLFEFQAALVVVSTGGVVQSLDAKDGTVKWKREIAEGFSDGPSFSGDAVLLATTSNQVFTISLLSGEIRSMRKTDVSIKAASVQSTGELITGDDRGNVFFFPDATDKALWRYKSGAAISSLRLIDGHLLVTSNDNFVYYLSMPRGGLAWKKRFAGRVSHIGIFETSLALVSSLEEHGATFISLASGKPLGQVVFSADEFMVADPIFADGKIIVLTNDRAIAYSLNDCSAKNEGGLSESPKPPTQKN